MKFANRYQLDHLYNQGLEGQGQRIGIIAGTDFRIGDIQKYWQQVGVNTNTNRIHRIYTVGTKKAVRAIDGYQLTMPQTEASLDVQNASSVAPKANIDVYIYQPANGATSKTSAHYTGFMQAISDNQDKQLSTSFLPGDEFQPTWSDHSATMKQYNHAFNLILEQAAVQGITVFSGSGDNGPYEERTSQQIHLNSTSPYQVLVGGTTLPYERVVNGKTISVKKERAWGNTYDVTASEIKSGYFAGSGGGFSLLNPTPRYQEGVPGVNTFRAIQLLNFVGKPATGRFIINKNPKVITGTGHSRNFPDVAGNADNQTGYATYTSGYAVGVKNKKKVRLPIKIWYTGGGTSYVTPQMAAANAVMNSGQTTPIGFWNPQIYKFAQQSDTPFNVLDDANDNNNLYYTGQLGKIYNQATGLGTINFEKLYSKFSSESVSN